MFDFPTDGDVTGWSVVNDTVMGGVSTGQLAWQDGASVFTGELSLDDNGGFASVRSPLNPTAAAGWTDRAGMGVAAQGDGRVWTVEVRTDGEDGIEAPFRLALLRPAPLFAFVYGAATLVMLAAVSLDGPRGLRVVAGTATHWEPWLLVASVAGIELGVYPMYRSGWSISTTSVTTQVVSPDSRCVSSTQA